MILIFLKFISDLVFKADNGSVEGKKKKKKCRTTIEISTGPQAQSLSKKLGQAQTNSGSGKVRDKQDCENASLCSSTVEIPAQNHCQEKPPCFFLIV